ncbi:unnamed protein product [Penicillium salamii]|uniref:Uncharacterized protein n=1 Tax=Penicillium salamii TaxID=1612424 RepID=A0A9W4NA31_9EURO|nr:unnamed protein product [Penicillium salamii]
MFFFVCPRLRKGPRHVSSSDFAQSYQENQSANTDGSGEPAQDPSQGENSLPAQCQKRTAASFSSRLRRRLSRESRQSGEQSMNFPFSLKPKPSISKTDAELPVFADMGSSLMSARGYDSDAQCVGTPQHVGNVNQSPRTPTSRRMGLNNNVQGHREHNNMGYWNSPNLHAHPDSPASFGMSAPSTPQGSMEGLPHPSDAQHTARSTDNLSTTSLNNQRSAEQNHFAKPLTSLHPSQEQLVPSNQVVNHRQGLYLGSSSENFQDLVGDWAQYMKSNAIGLPNASSESLSRQSPEIMMSKRRQHSSSPRTHPEAHVPYLGDLDLSHRLAGSPLASGSQSANPSITNPPHANRHGLRMVSSENVQSDMTSGSSTVVLPETPTRSMPQHRDVSSFYSRQSDETAGNASSAIHSLRVHAANAMDSLPNIKGRLFGEVGFVEDAPGVTGEVIKGKFDDHEQANTQSPQSPRALPTPTEGMRKVSPGWMTGGRRVGYGYRMVDNADELTHHGVDDVPTTGIVKHEDLGGNDGRRAVSQPPVQPSIPYDNDPKNDPVRTPSNWTKLKRNSVRDRSHAPLAVDLASKDMSPRGPHGARAILVQPQHSPTPASVEYVEDDGNFVGRWSRNSFSLRRRLSQLHKKDDSSPERELCTPDVSPTVNRRCSMDQTTRCPSVYFDPANERSADKVNGQPSRSRSGRWILRFSRNRDSRRRSSKPVKQPSPESSAEYECPSSGLGRPDSMMGDIAADLANEYQQCIQMPRAFYGSGWASRTSLIVEAE